MSRGRERTDRYLGVRERMTSLDFRSFVKKPLDAKSGDLLARLERPPVLTLAEGIDNPRLVRMISEEFDSLPIEIRVTRQNQKMIQEAGLGGPKPRVGSLLVDSDLESRLPLIVIENLRRLSLERDDPFATSQREFLEAYLDWVKLFFDHWSGKTGVEIAQERGVSRNRIYEWLHSQLPLVLFNVAIPNRKLSRDLQRDFSKSSQKLAVVIGVLLFRGRLAGDRGSFWEKISIDKRELVIGEVIMGDFFHLFQNREEEFFWSLNAEERDLTVRKIFELYGSEKTEGILLFREGSQGQNALRRIQEYLASCGVYSIVYPQEVGGKEFFRLFVHQSQLERYRRWFKEGEKSDGLGMWEEIYFSRYHCYRNGLSQEGYDEDLGWLRRQRRNNEDIPSKSSIQRWRRGYPVVPKRLRGYFDAYGFKSNESDDKEMINQACRLYLRRGEVVVHLLRKRFPQLSLPRLTKMFLAVDSLFYQIPEIEDTSGWRKEIEPAMNQWRFLLNNEILSSLPKLDLFERGFMSVVSAVDEKVFAQIESVQNKLIDFTDLPIDALSLYLKSIEGIPLLSSQQEIVLAKLIEQGKLATDLLKNGGEEDLFMTARLRKFSQIGSRARDCFVRANTGLVIAIAKEYTGRGLPLRDLIQEGNIGLIKAVEEFDWRKGHKFSTNATNWIRATINRAISNDSRTVRLPRHLRISIGEIDEVDQALGTKFGRRPSFKEIADELGIDPFKVEMMVIWSALPASLDQEIREGEEATLGEIVKDTKIPLPQDEVERKFFEETIRWWIQTLSYREEMVLRLRFGLDDGQFRDLWEVGEKMGLSREGIRQIIIEAIKRLLHPSKLRRIKPYLH